MIATVATITVALLIALAVWRATHRQHERAELQARAWHDHHALTPDGDGPTHDPGAQGDGAQQEGTRQ